MIIILFSLPKVLRQSPEVVNWFVWHFVVYCKVKINNTLCEHSFHSLSDLWTARKSSLQGTAQTGIYRRKLWRDRIEKKTKKPAVLESTKKPKTKSAIFNILNKNHSRDQQFFSNLCSSVQRSGRHLSSQALRLRLTRPRSCRCCRFYTVPIWWSDTIWFLWFVRPSCPLSKKKKRNK